MYGSKVTKFRCGTKNALECSEMVNTYTPYPTCSYVNLYLNTHVDILVYKFVRKIVGNYF